MGADTMACARAFLLAGLATLTAGPAPLSGMPLDDISTASDAEYLNELEKDVILHLNMARTDPAGYAEDFIEPRLRYFSGTDYNEPEGPIQRTVEGELAVAECVSDMKGTEPMGVLLPSHAISLAAADHAADHSETGNRGHTGSDGSTFDTRIERYADWRGTIGEVIAFGPRNGREIVAILLIDDGVADRGHRINLLNPDFRYVGVAIEEHPEYGYVCVIDFAADYDPIDGQYPD